MTEHSRDEWLPPSDAERILGDKQDTPPPPEVTPAQVHFARVGTAVLMYSLLIFVTLFIILGGFKFLQWVVGL